MIPDPLTCFPPTANQHYARAARDTAKMAITFHVAASVSASSVVARNQRSNSQAPSLESAKQRSVAMRVRGGACRAKLRPTSGVDCQGALKPTRAPCCGTSTRAAARASHPPPAFPHPCPASLPPPHGHNGSARVSPRYLGPDRLSFWSSSTFIVVSLPHRRPRVLAYWLATLNVAFCPTSSGCAR